MEELRPEEIKDLLKELEEEYGTEETSPHEASYDAFQCLEQAYAAEARDEFEPALAKCDGAIQLNPGLAEAHNLRGIVLEEMGCKQEAVAAYREAVRLEPNLREAGENLQELEAELKEDEAEPCPYENKGFRIRAVAYVIDLGVIYLLNYAAGALGSAVLVTVLVAVMWSTGQIYQFNDQSAEYLHLIGGTVLGVLYFTTFEGLYGATPGKLVLGMRVVKLSGEPCGLGAAFIRALLRFVDGLFLALPAYHSMKSPLRQRIGDKAAETMVLSSRDPMIRQPRVWWRFLAALGLYLSLATFTLVGLISTGLERDRAIEDLEQAAAYYEQGNLHLAIEEYTQAITLDPQDAVAHDNRGNAYYDRGELDQVIAIDSQLAIAFFNRALANADRGELDPATGDLERALDLGLSPDVKQDTEDTLEELGR